MDSFIYKSSYPLSPKLSAPRQSIVSNLALNPNQILKLGVWAYFFLLIFEGALRKWFLPGFATPLLIIRDPLALWLLYITWKRGLLSANLYTVGMILIAIIGIITALILGHGNLPVAVFGARILLIHFPLIFVIGNIFTREDVIKIGKIALWISIPMTILIAIQFYSPQSAWVNHGVGGDIEGAGFPGANGFFRPPATFSFTNGTALFFGFVASFIFYFWLNPKGINRLLLITASISILVAIPLSISRTLLAMVGITFLFTTFAISQKPKYLGKIFLLIMILLVGLATLNNTQFFQTAIEAFSSRFESASEIEGGLEGTIVDRFLGGLFDPLIGATEQPFFGKGIGMGTNVGNKLLTGKDTGFLIAEGEWGRLIGELGPLIGIIAIIIRLHLCTKIALTSYRKLLSNDLLPWMLLSFGLLQVAQGQWAQPTSLGFSTLIGGLMIASFNTSDNNRIQK